MSGSPDIADLKQGRRRRLPSVDTGRLDRLPPHSLEAEQGVIGCLLLDPRLGLPVCIEKFKAGKEVFYDLRLQTIYELLVDMSEAREAIDLITVQQKLKDKGQLEAMGGVAYLAQLQDAVPSAANLEYYVEIVREKRLLRNLLTTCSGVIGRIYETEDDVEGFVDSVEADLLRMAEERVECRDQDMRALVLESIDQIEHCHAHQGHLTGLGSGFPDLDQLTNGFQRGDMIVVAARPSVGKSALMLNVLDHVAITLGQPVALFSLEMPARQMVQRLMCARASVNLRDAQRGHLTERDFVRLTAAGGTLQGAPIHIDDSAGLTVLQLRAKARRMHQQHGVKMVAIDYLQLLRASGRKDSRQEDVADMSNGIKALAKELDVPILVLAQLNRDSEREKREPRLADLRESGAIEQDADAVMLLSREIEDPGEALRSRGEPVILNLVKQRNGPTDRLKLTFLREWTRFESAARVAEEDVPV